jgi:DNA-binding NarL/FixJ family response regulator
MDVLKVMLVDDHAHAREGMRDILSLHPNFEVVGEATHGLEALDHVERLMPDLILMDIHMKEIDGLETTKLIKEKYPYIKIVIVTVSDDISHLFEAIKRGAQGYLLKNLHPSTWIEYLVAIANDEAPMSKELAFQILKEFNQTAVPNQDYSVLTHREQDILRLVAQGLANKQIGEQLVISEHTVKNHLKNIMQKLHVENRVLLTKYAFESGLMNEK